MDIPMIQNAVGVANFPKEVLEWIWEVKRDNFAIFT